MAISTYSELKTAVTEWMHRSDVSGKADDFVTLAEARLNRVLDAVESDVTLTGTVNSRVIDISAYSVIEPMSLWLAETGKDEEAVLYKTPGTFPYLDDTGEPGFWTVNGTDIKFNRPLDSAYPFRFRYRGRFSLSDASPTNSLLTNHPDVYLAASIVWGGIFTKDSPLIAGYKSILDEFIDETSWHLAQKKRGVLSVDPMFSTNYNDKWWMQE